MDYFGSNHVRLDSGSFTRKRKRTTTACVRCHERKVKCDAAASPNGGPCKNCLATGETCRSHLDGRARANQPHPSLSSSSIRDRDRAQDRHDDRNSDNGLQSPDTSTSLRILSPVPRAADASVERFEAYVEDNLGSLAPTFRSKNGNATSSSGGTSSARTDLPQFQYLSPSSPVQQVDVDMTTRATLELEQQMEDLDPADMEYLKAKGAFGLPPRHLQQVLIDAHFSEAHPTAPVINRREFLSRFHDGTTQSRLLLFAIFTSGARVCRHPGLLDHQGSSHTSARRFYKATKALLDTGYERNKLVRIQALLLITWWWDKKDDGGRNMRSCAVDAINTAQSIGMHRWDQYPHSDRVLLGLWKRVWWSCVNRDVGVAVAHGLPCMLSLSEFDVHPLTPEDFNEGPANSPGTQRYGYSETEIMFMTEQTKVAEALHHIHDKYFVRQRLQQQTTGFIWSREAQVAHGSTAPPGQKPASAGYPDDYRDDGLVLCRAWLGQVPQAVSTNIMLRFREVSVSRPTDRHSIAERDYCRARGIAAATMVSKIIRNMRAHGHLLRCTGQLTNILFNCLIFFLIESRSPNSKVRQDVKNKYTLCLNQLYEFSQLWISASLIHTLFESLQANMLLSSNREPSKHRAQQWHELFPGYQTSSELTQVHMRQLLDTEFQYTERSVDGNSLEESSVNPWMQPPSDPWSNVSEPLVGGLPDTLSVDAWLEFFDLRDADPSWIDAGPFP